jgi:hypothetical protein
MVLKNELLQFQLPSPLFFWNKTFAQTCLVPNESLYESIAKLSERYLLNLNLTQNHNKYTVE